MPLEAALAKPSADGRTYRQRIDSLRTERQMSLLYTDIIDEVPGGKTLLAGYNPVRTGGPHAGQRRLRPGGTSGNAPTAPPWSGIWAATCGKRCSPGVAASISALPTLLDYPAPYRDPIYRFADFNAGRYSSRNAAFQQALGRLSGQAMDLDGDLLDYANGVPSGKESATRKAARQLSGPVEAQQRPTSMPPSAWRKVRLSPARRLYQKVFALADETAGPRAAREIMPRIDLKSPKIRSKITTAWFADRVNLRYRLCLQRAAALPGAPTPGR